MSVRRARDRVGTDKNAPLLKADLADLNATGDKFLLEPKGTFVKRSRLIFYNSTRNYNITGLTSLQHDMVRQQYCPNGNIILQGNCAQRCSGCYVGQHQVDSSHAYVSTDGAISVMVNLATVIRL